MLVMPDIAMRQIREKAHITREDLIRKATKKLSMSTIRNAEKGIQVRYGTGVLIWEALNALLAERGHEQVKLEDLGMKLY